MKHYMQRFCLLSVAILSALSLSSSFAPARADDAAQPALAITQAAKTVDLTVYGEGFAQVEENREVKLQAGKVRIQLNGVAAKYRNDSLRLLDVKGAGDFKFRSATYQPANIDRLLELSVGKEISATLGSGTTTQKVTGKLVSVRNGQLVIEDAAGKVYLGSSQNVELTKLPEGLSTTASLVIEAETSAAGDYTLHFLYETDGVSWSAKHSLLYDEAAKKVESFESTVNVINQSGTSFDNANLWVLSGGVQQQRNVGRGLRSESAYLAPASASFDGASVESVGERKVYRIPGRVSLGDSQSRQIPLFSGKNVAVEHEYYVPVSVYSDGSGLTPVSARLKLRNCSEHNLGTPLPAGNVKVFQRNAESKIQLTSSAQVKEVAKDEQFEVSLGTASDVKAERVLVSSTTVTNNGSATPKVRPGQQAPEWEDQEYEVKVSNFKEKKAV
ncbi:MAG: hypothetical protein K2X93_08380, partial [Candidatus Obscuribacterales bacterium]|nr:hypothetical protein [Candidatus Obscuribacterales bacterium]